MDYRRIGWRGVAVLSSLGVAACGGVAATDTDGGTGTGSSGGPGSGSSSIGPSGGTGDASTSNASSGSTSRAETTSTGAVDDTGIRLDMGAIPDVFVEPPCEPWGDRAAGPDFRALWAANSVEGTISRIDTQTVTEVGRFIVRPDGAGSPSRTSVALSGKVAVASRTGGVTAFHARVEDCVESNGTPGIQTSTDDTPLPWDEEECRAWHAPFDYTTQRPVAWTPATWNQETCQWEDELLWTAGRIGSVETADVLLLDGEDGAVLEMVTIQGLTADIFGLYGAAVDRFGNLWATQLGGTRLVRVLLEDMSTQVWVPPVQSGYGMAVDREGAVYLCSQVVQRFDPSTDTWLQSTPGIGYTGCGLDGGEGGLLWSSGPFMIRGLNPETLAIEQEWSVPGAYGMSVDFEGNVWAVANNGGAHRVDPSDGSVSSYNGLVGAYTYSDMTGTALYSVSDYSQR